MTSARISWLTALTLFACDADAPRWEDPDERGQANPTAQDMQEDHFLHVERVEIRADRSTSGVTTHSYPLGPCPFTGIRGTAELTVGWKTSIVDGAQKIGIDWVEVSGQSDVGSARFLTLNGHDGQFQSLLDPLDGNDYRYDLDEEVWTFDVGDERVQLYLTSNLDIGDELCGADTSLMRFVFDSPMPEFEGAPVVYATKVDEHPTAAWITPSIGLLSFVNEDKFWNYDLGTRTWGASGRFSELRCENENDCSPWKRLTPADGWWPWTRHDKGITAGWVNEEFYPVGGTTLGGFFTVIATDYYWSLCMPGNPECERFGGDYRQMSHGHLSRWPDSWGEVNGSEPFEGDGVTAGWVDTRADTFTVVSRDKYWVVNMDIDLTIRNRGLIAQGGPGNPFGHTLNYHFPGGDYYPHDGEGVTASWYDSQRDMATVLSGQHYWVLDATADYQVVDAGMLTD